MRTTNYKFLKERLEGMKVDGVKILRNAYGCLGASCVLVTYAAYLYKFYFSYVPLFEHLLPLLPVLLFLTISFGVVIANYVFLICLDIFDIIAHYLICGTRAKNKKEE